MKASRYCVKRGLVALRKGITKATSYEVVKSRLNYRWYHDDLLKARDQYIDSLRNQNKL